MLPINPVARSALSAVLLIGAVLAVYYSGYGYAKRQAALEQAALVARYQTEALKAEQAYSAQLAEAAAEKQRWFDYSQRQSRQLAEAARQLDARQGYLKQEIPHALKRDEAGDGACRPGLGADGLRLYRQALGYAPD